MSVTRDRYYRVKTAMLSRKIPDGISDVRLHLPKKKMNSTNQSIKRVLDEGLQENDVQYAWKNVHCQGVTFSQNSLLNDENP